MAQLSKELMDYIRITSTADIQPILQPLLHLKINYFLFVREFNNGKRLWLTNNGRWTEHFFQKEYYKNSAFENPHEARVEGVYLWKFLRGQEVFQDARESFGIEHGITVIEKQKSHNDFFHFGFEKGYGEACTALIEKIDILTSFNKYFKFQANKLIHKAEKNMIELPMASPALTESSPILIHGEDIKNFLQDISVGRYHPEGDVSSVHLTKKEVECLQWCSLGKTHEEISVIMGLKKRTVDAHMENIKRKLNCYKQFALGYMLAKKQLI